MSRASVVVVPLVNLSHILSCVVVLISADNSLIYFSTASERRPRALRYPLNALRTRALLSSLYKTPLAADTFGVISDDAKGRPPPRRPVFSPIIHTGRVTEARARVSLGRTSNDRSYAVCAMRRGHSDDSRRHFVVHGYAVARPLA